MTNDQPTPDRAKVILDRDAMYRRTDEEWEALEEAIGTVYGFKSGHTLTEADVAALELVDRCQRDDVESATEAYNQGREEGLRERGGDELVALNKRVGDAFLDKMTERTMRVMAEARVFTLTATLSESEGREKALREALARHEEDLSVIHRAAAHCQGKFGGRMSEIDRIFQEIVRVSSMHKRRAVVTPQEGRADA